jgi:AraC-like DNA-binding protein
MPAYRQRNRRLCAESHELEMPLVQQIGINLLREPLALPPHHHPAGYEMTYLLSGEVTWQIVSGPSMHLTGGDLAIIQPDVMHQGEYEIIQPCRLLWIVITPQVPHAERFTPFTPAQIAQVAHHLAAAGNRVVHAGTALAATFHELEACLRTLRGGERDDWLLPRLRSSINTVIMQILGALSAHGASSVSPAIAAAQAYIADHVMSPILMQDVAAQAGLRPSRFYQRFKQEVGQTPADYCNRLRCALAREMLTNTSRSITDIALHFGFCSSQYFADTFRKYTGMTPTAYRAQFHA